MLHALRNFFTVSLHELIPTPGDHMFWCGDFNRHHPLWETEVNRHLFNPSSMIDPLIDLITEHNMVLALPPGIQTYESTTSNWTHPDNIWSNNQPDSPITICDVNPSIHPLLADHLPILLMLDLPIHRASMSPTLDMFLTDFNTVNTKLSALLVQRCLAKELCSVNKLKEAVNSLVVAIQETLAQEVPLAKSCPYMKCWWLK